ncbi:MAG: nucleotide-binding universal stress UspA family protein [Methanobacteriota archaeon]|uniref:Universal stress protein n=1 Tax=Halorutilus salinus TaxID=2487751 RepID=A0A9Q4C314_9EURY|nr:universal stress protein [Halorutilus salinus]MCX2818538.1 universal stress protein [Halorutilus salinus]
MKLTQTVVVPVASPDDATTTAEAVAPYLGEVERLVFVYVVEKAGGAPDKASVEQREGYADEIFETARETIGANGSSTEIDGRVVYGTGIADAVFDLCDKIGAESVALVPRDSSRLLDLLVGGRMDAFVRDNNVPVVVLPND